MILIHIICDWCGSAVEKAGFDISMPKEWYVIEHAQAELYFCGFACNTAWQLQEQHKRTEAGMLDLLKLPKKAIPKQNSGG